MSEFPDKKYKVIYADPPWSYSNKLGNDPRWGAMTYPTMSLKDICNLPVKDLADEDCVLFIWVTMPLLEESFQVINSWGFKYITCAFSWIKINKNDGKPRSGLGQWTNANAEICLLAKKGKPKRVAKNVKQAILAPVTRHSEKPFEIRDRIVSLMGDIPRIELFARTSAPGWDSWGNQLDEETR